MVMNRPPRFRSAVVAGLGTGGSLAAATVCILAIGTATFTFVDWPGGETRERAAAAQLGEPVAPPRSLDGPASAPAAGPTARAIRRTEKAAKRPRRARPATPGPRRMPAREAPSSTPPSRDAAPGAVVPSVRAKPTPTPVPQGKADPPPTLLRGPVQQLTQEVREVGQTTGAALSDVSPLAGDLLTGVTDTTATVADGVVRLLP